MAAVAPGRVRRADGAADTGGTGAADVVASGALTAAADGVFTIGPAVAGEVFFGSGAAAGAAAVACDRARAAAPGADAVPEGAP